MLAGKDFEIWLVYMTAIRRHCCTRGLPITQYLDLYQCILKGAKKCDPDVQVYWNFFKSIRALTGWLKGV